jgi:hypothetical protein
MAMGFGHGLPLEHWYERERERERWHTKLLGDANNHVAAPINGGDFDAYYLVTDIYGVRVTSAPDKASSGSRPSNLRGQLKNLPNLRKSCDDISLSVFV